MERKNNAIEKRVTEMVSVLHISHYHRFLITEMVCRKLQNPLEKVDKILQEVTTKSTLEKFRLSRGKTKEFVKVSYSKELDRLEEALHECDNLPNADELQRGFIVANTVKYYAKMVMDE